MHPEDRARARKEITAKLEQVVRTGTDVDNDLTEVFDTASAGLYGIGQTGSLSTAAAAGSQAVTASPPAPPKHGTPAQNAAWWRSLSGAEQNTIIQHAPDQIGNLDGVPAEARSKANMKRLPEMKARLQKERDRLRQQVMPGGPVTADASGKLNFVEGKLKSLEQVTKTMHKNDGSHRQLMLLDDSHRRLEAGVGLGDVDKAEHVTVFTPGMNSTVDDGLGEYDDDMRKLTEESDDMSDRHGDGGKTASVTWIGYQAPQTSELGDPYHSAALPFDASSAGNNLNDFSKGIEESREGTHSGSPHMTAIGHSYGSVATGASIGNSDTPVDDVMLMGSPGMMIDDAKVPDGHVYSEWVKDDYIPYTNMGGTLGPNTYDHENSELLSTGAHNGHDGPMREATGHGVTEGYLADKTTSQHNTAAVVTGNQDLAQHSTPDEFKRDRLGY